MVTLSPRLLLEILPEPALDEISWDVREDIDNDKFEEFQRRTIGNTFREIIFSDKELLGNWRQTEIFEKRVSIINNMKSYNSRFINDKQQELWQLNTFGNQNISKSTQKQKRRHSRK
jgi:hypothetical protein